MYLIMVYDINEKRVNRVLKIGRKYLEWVQNSVLEGEITEAKFEKLKAELVNTIDPDEDSVIFYIMRTVKYTERQMMGLSKGGFQRFI